jgi:hypothetical protein
MRIKFSRVLSIRREQDELGVLYSYFEGRGEVRVTSSGDSLRIDDRVKKSDSAEKRATIFAKRATKRKWSRS